MTKQELKNVVSNLTLILPHIERQVHNLKYMQIGEFGYKLTEVEDMVKGYQAQIVELKKELEGIIK